MPSVKPDTPAPLQSNDHSAFTESSEAEFSNEKVRKFDTLLLFIFTSLFIVVFLQFFTRYVLNNSIAWTEEAARYLLILLAFSGAIRCQVKSSHITLSFMNKFYGRWNSVIQILSLLLSIAVLSVIAWSALALVEVTKYQRMISLPFPKYYLHVGVALMLMINIPVCFWQVVMCLRKLVR